MTRKTVASLVLALIVSAVFTTEINAKPTSTAPAYGLSAVGSHKAIHRHIRHARHHRSHRVRVARSGATVSRSCLTTDTRSILDSAERHFNTKFVLVSTCRPGAVIAGTRHASQHGFGRAVDLKVPASISKQSVVNWLYANSPGVTMVYRGMSHVHFDTGPYHKLACGGCGVRHSHVRMARKVTHRRYAHAL